jgi:hypothetical protein
MCFYLQLIWTRQSEQHLSLLDANGPYVEEIIRYVAAVFSILINILICTKRSDGTIGRFIVIVLPTKRSAGTNGTLPVIALLARRTEYE